MWQPHGAMEGPRSGDFAKRFIVAFLHWTIGILSYWYIDQLVYCSIGILNHFILIDVVRVE